VFIRVYLGDVVSHVGIFDPALRTVAPLTFSLVSSPPPSPSPLPCVNKYRYTVCTYTVCKEVGYGVIGREEASDR
jgi:hypothetical protein